MKIPACLAGVLILSAAYPANAQEPLIPNTFETF